MLTLYDNPFSPLCRKVRLVLAYKDLPCRRVDALALEHATRLAEINPRAEVPVLVDDGFTVSGSARIVAYLEDLQTAPSILPESARSRARARSWEALADGVLDAIVHDVSIWQWPTHRRDDEPPPGLLEAGRRDIEKILERLEEELRGSRYLCGDLSIADLAVFPHVSSLKPIGVLLDPATHPSLFEWNRRMRSLEIVRDDLRFVRSQLTKKFVEGPSPYEGEKIVWRGDRIEWLLEKGFADWWQSELRAKRVIVPRGI